MIDPDRARELTRLGKQADRARRQRDAAIIAAVADGAGIREVARLVGLNHTSVLHILRRESAVDP